MDTKEISENLSSQLNKRINNPFLFSFLTSWPLVNYKIILALLSSDNYKDKIKFISEDVYPENTKWIFTIGLPLAAAIFYTFIYPFIDIVIANFSQWAENLKTRTVLAIARKKPVDTEAHVAILVEHEERSKVYQETLQRRQETYQKFKSESHSRIMDLQGRLHRQTLELFCTGTDLAPGSAVHLIMQDAGSASELGDYQQMLEAFQKSPHAKNLKAFAALALTLPENDEITSIDHHEIQDKVVKGGDIKETNALVEILLALQIISQNTLSQSYSINREFCSRVVEVYEKGK
jgi:hypothetical protein